MRKSPRILSVFAWERLPRSKFNAEKLTQAMREYAMEDLSVPKWTEESQVEDASMSL